MKAEDVSGWIQRRCGCEATPTLVGLLGRFSEAGYGWLAAEPNRWELGRSIDADHWEEVVIWVAPTLTGLIGLTSAQRATRTIEARTRRADELESWATPRGAA